MNFEDEITSGQKRKDRNMSILEIVLLGTVVVRLAFLFSRYQIEIF